MKGIILAGGSGSRLWPMTRAMSKHLLPVYDKPMIYYALSTLMQIGLRDITIITTPQDANRYQNLLCDGTAWGITLHYAVQEKPQGIAQAILICAQWIADTPVCLILGDNLIFDPKIGQSGRDAAAHITRAQGAHIFLSQVAHPERYGVVQYDGEVITDIIEKPAIPPSYDSVIGLYMYGHDVVARAKELKLSARGELEITDLNRSYLADARLHHTKLQNAVWLDMGTPESMQDAAAFVATIYHRQGFKVGCVEQIAHEQGWIDNAQLRACAQDMNKSDYGYYLQGLLKPRSQADSRP
ncbi:MAG: sugar phosphate nucleotidyltransferase [Pseudomonadota bacterium]